jgi:hypothetical protein
MLNLLLLFMVLISPSYVVDHPTFTVKLSATDVSRLRALAGTTEGTEHPGGYYPSNLDSAEYEMAERYLPKGKPAADCNWGKGLSSADPKEGYRGKVSENLLVVTYYWGWPNCIVIA